MASSDLPYRRCVGIMVINKQGKVLVGRRNDSKYGSEAWQMPQGGIDKGEEPEAAAYREMEEEVGLTKKSVDLIAHSPDWISYDLPKNLQGYALKGKYRGQRQKWFAFRLTGKDSDINIETAIPEFDAWKWVKMKKLPDLIVDFKRDSYKQIVACFEHIGSDD